MKSGSRLRNSDIGDAARSIKGGVIGLQWGCACTGFRRRDGRSNAPQTPSNEGMRDNDSGSAKNRIPDRGSSGQRTSEKRHPPSTPRERRQSLNSHGPKRQGPKGIAGSAQGHAFMPDSLCFSWRPRDPGDNRVPLARPLAGPVLDKLLAEPKTRFHDHARPRPRGGLLPGKCLEEAHFAERLPSFAGSLRPMSRIPLSCRGHHTPGQSRPGFLIPASSRVLRRNWDLAFPRAAQR